MSYRKGFAIFALALSAVGATISASSMSFDEADQKKYISGTLVGPSYEEAVRSNPGVIAARVKANSAKWIFSIFLVVSVIQLALIVTDKKSASLDD